MVLKIAQGLEQPSLPRGLSHRILESWLGCWVSLVGPHLGHACAGLCLRMIPFKKGHFWIHVWSPHFISCGFPVSVSPTLSFCLSVSLTHRLPSPRPDRG